MAASRERYAVTRFSAYLALRWRGSDEALCDLQLSLRGNHGLRCSAGDCSHSTSARAGERVAAEWAGDRGAARRLGGQHGRGCFGVGVGNRARSCHQLQLLEAPWSYDGQLSRVSRRSSDARLRRRPMPENPSSTSVSSLCVGSSVRVSLCTGSSCVWQPARSLHRAS